MNSHMTFGTRKTNMFSKNPAFHPFGGGKKICDVVLSEFTKDDYAEIAWELQNVLDCNITLSSCYKGGFSVLGDVRLLEGQNECQWDSALREYQILPGTEYNFPSFNNREELEEQVKSAYCWQKWENNRFDLLMDEKRMKGNVVVLPWCVNTGPNAIPLLYAAKFVECLLKKKYVVINIHEKIQRFLKLGIPQEEVIEEPTCGMKRVFPVENVMDDICSHHKRRNVNDEF